MKIKETGKQPKRDENINQAGNTKIILSRRDFFKNQYFYDFLQKMKMVTSSGDTVYIFRRMIILLYHLMI